MSSYGLPLWGPSTMLRSEIRRETDVAHGYNRYEIEKRLREVYTIVKLPNIELLIAAGDVKEKKEDLKKIARESSRPGVDHRFMFAPLKVRSFNVSV